MTDNRISLAEEMKLRAALLAEQEAHKKAKDELVIAEASIGDQRTRILRWSKDYEDEAKRKHEFAAQLDSARADLRDLQDRPTVDDYMWQVQEIRDLRYRRDVYMWWITYAEITEGAGVSDYERGWYVTARAYYVRRYYASSWGAIEAYYRAWHQDERGKRVEVA